MAWRTSRRGFARALAGVVLLRQARASEGLLQRFEGVEPHMGTLFRVTLYARGRDAARTALRAGFDEVRRLDEALSDYREDSELNRLCRAPSGKPFAVSEPLFEALSLSQEISGETDGAFDVTLGPLIRLWRQARKQVELPPEPARREALALCGYRKLRLDARARTAALAAPGMQLDLGGIGKGLAADRALHAIVLHGCPAALVAAGGDVRAGDPPPGEPGWKVGVEGLGSGDGFSRILSLTHGAVSTSGDADQFVEIGGVRYSHIVDPRTGLGLTERLTATVMARASARADALATAASVLGVERGMAWLETQEGVEALLLAVSGKGYAETATTGFPPRAVTQQAPARY